MRQRAGAGRRGSAWRRRQRARRHPELLEIARERTPSADLRIGDIQELPYDDDAFDVVTAFNSSSTRSTRRSQSPNWAASAAVGGQVAIGIWGDPARCETEGLFARLRSLAPPPPGTPAPLALSEAGVVEDLLVKAGLSVQGGAEVPFPITFATLDDAWRAHISAGPFQKVILIAGAEQVRRVLDEVLTADRKPDGSLRQDNVLRYVPQ